jgi:hypothetical protein
MAVDHGQLEQLREGCPGAKAMTEGGKEYVYLPKLTIVCKGAAHDVEALLSLSEASPYATRLFLSKQIPDSGLNWHHQIHVMDKTWYTWSWRDVTADDLLVNILRAHMGAFKK